MPAERITISPCAAGEVAALQRFIDERWRRGHILARDRELLCWQYDPQRMTCGAWDGPTVLLARRGGDVVGMQCLIAAEFSFHGQRASGAWLSNLLAIPEVRDQGVGLQLLMALGALGFDAVFDLGINADVRRLFSALKYEILEDLPRWVAVLDARQTAELMDPAPDLRGLEVAVSPRGGTLEVHTPPVSFGVAWDGLWRRELAPRLMGTARNSAYLNWRYVHHPRFVHDIRVACGADGAPLGLSVSRHEQVLGREARVWRVLEFLATPAAAGVLAADLVARARAGGAALADFYCASSTLAAPLVAAGFVRQSADGPLAQLPARFCPLEPGPFRMTAALKLSRPLRASLGPLVGREDLYITKSDGDMDRPNSAGPTAGGAALGAPDQARVHGCSESEGHV